MTLPRSEHAHPENNRRDAVIRRLKQVVHRLNPLRERRTGDAALADTARQLDIMLRSIGEAVLATDTAGCLVRMNPAAESLLQRWAVDVIGRPVSGLFQLRTHGAEGRDCDPVGRLLRDGATMERAERLVLRRPDGSDRIVSLVATPICENAGAFSGVVLVMRDVTAAHQLEEQVRRTQRVESLAQLAGGVAHDFNNLLQVVRVNLEFLAEKKGLDAEACEFVGEIQHAAGRAADLTRQLLALGRRQALRREPLDPMALIEPFVRVMRRVLGDNVEVVFDAHPPIDWVCVDASQLEQVLLNLAANARDAMPLGGRLVIGLRMVDLTDDDAKRESWARPGRWVCIGLSDTGLGMDEPTLARIFEPFFTTKGLGKGTGLGLSVVLGVVQQQDGLVNVTSRLGHGTSFEIYLPAVSKPESTDVPAPVLKPAAPPTVTTDPCILLVEDDPSVRVVSTAVLVRHGYRVVEAADGVEAFDLVKARGNEFSLVIMDVIMPRMGGIEAAHEIEQIFPGLPVILCTGYAGSGAPEIVDGSDRWQVLAKPFGSHELLRAVKNAGLMKNAE